MIITMREYEIMKKIRDNITPVSAELLCNSLDISQRTLRYEVSILNGAAKEQFILSGSQGYYISSEIDLTDLFGEIEIEDFEHGVNWMCIKILDKGDLSVSDLEERFLKSTSAVRNALKKIEEEMSRFDLHLEKKGNNLRVLGKESDQRRMIMHAFFFDNKTEGRVDENTERYFHAIVPDITQELIEETMAEQQLEIGDIYLRNIVLLIAVSVERIRQGHEMEDIETEADCLTEIERSFIDSVAEKIQKFANIAISMPERNFLAQSVLGLLCAENATEKAEYIAGYNQSTFRKILTEALQSTFSHYHITCDYSKIMDSFALHVFYLLARVQTNSFFKNDITGALQHTHPVVYEASIYLASKLENNFQIKIPKEEIGLLALYVGPLMEREWDERRIHVILVCPQYNGIREMLCRKLKLFFEAQLIIKKTVSSYEQIELDEEYDFIISVIERQKSLKNIVYVTPLMGANEFEKIEKKMAKILKKKGMEELERCFRSYLKKQHFFYNEPYRTGTEVLSFLAKKLTEEDAVPEGYLEDVIKREKLASTAFFNQVAVPHALEMKAKETNLLYYYSKEPIEWFGNSVHLVLLLASKGYDQEFSKLYGILFDVILEEEMCLKIQKCQTYEELMKFILDRV